MNRVYIHTSMRKISAQCAVSQIRSKRPSVHLSRAICPSIKRSSARLRDGMRGVPPFVPRQDIAQRDNAARVRGINVCVCVRVWVRAQRENSGVIFARGSQTSSVGRSVVLFRRVRVWAKYKSASSALSASNLPPIARLRRYVNVVPHFPTARGARAEKC